MALFSSKALQEDFYSKSSGSRIVQCTVAPTRKIHVHLACTTHPTKAARGLCRRCLQTLEIGSSVMHVAACWLCLTRRGPGCRAKDNCARNREPRQQTHAVLLCPHVGLAGCILQRVVRTRQNLFSV